MAQSAQTQSLTWQQVRDRFEQNNPTLQADNSTSDESKAEEITAIPPSESTTQRFRRMELN